MEINREEEIGKLAIRYNENEQEISTLTVAIDTTGRLLELFGHAVRSSPLRLSVSDSGFSTGDQRGELPHDALSVLAENLDALRKAREDKYKMEECLQQAGLGYLVRR